MSTSQTPGFPPYQLEGKVLENGWTVGRKIDKKPTDTGGAFSVGYECNTPEHGKVFIKVIDLYSPLQNQSDVLAPLQALLAAVNGERELLDECRRMDRVVNVIHNGQLNQLAGSQLTIPIPYIVFELAEGSARSVLFGGTPPTNAWKLRTLHQVAVGLWQLHNKMIAHQDLKLSNILIFDDNGGAKVTDLGRSVQQGRNLPHDSLEWPGDYGYAPPEYLYGFTPNEFNIRRLSADLYLLGSCICFIFTDMSMNALIGGNLPDNFKPYRFGGTYAGNFQDVLPHLYDAFAKSLERLELSLRNTPYKDQLVAMVRQCCDPDPEKRGHPLTRSRNASGGNMFSLERYLSQLDNLAKKAEIHDRLGH